MTSRTRCPFRLVLCWFPRRSATSGTCQRALVTRWPPATWSCARTPGTPRGCWRRWVCAARTEPLHEHNEDARIGPVLALLRAGRRVALVSDAGTPLLSDPGLPAGARGDRRGPAGERGARTECGADRAGAVRAAAAAVPVPRLSRRRARRRAGPAFGGLRAAERAGLAATLIWHEAPHRLAETLADMAAAFGDRPAAVARELTKRFEEVRRGTLPELAAYYAATAGAGRDHRAGRAGRADERGCGGAGRAAARGAGRRTA